MARTLSSVLYDESRSIIPDGHPQTVPAIMEQDHHLGSGGVLANIGQRLFDNPLTFRLECPHSNAKSASAKPTGRMSQTA